MRLATFLFMGLVLAACGGDAGTGASLASQPHAPVADATLFESSDGGSLKVLGPSCLPVEREKATMRADVSFCASRCLALSRSPLAT